MLNIISHQWNANQNHSNIPSHTLEWLDMLESLTQWRWVWVNAGIWWWTGRPGPHDCRPQGLQHSRLPYLSPTPGACSNSSPLSQWCHPTISSSFIPFSSCLHSFPASGSFPISQSFTSGGQTIRASTSTSVLPMNIHDWFPLGLTGLIPLQSKGLSRVFSYTTVQKHRSSLLNFIYGPTLTSILNDWRNHSFDRETFIGKVMSPFFNILSKLVIAFLRRNKRLLISWLQSPSVVILEPKKIKSVTDYYRFLVNSGIRKCESFNLVIFKII